MIYTALLETFKFIPKLILEHLHWCQVKAYTHVIHPVVGYVNLLICIVMNINEKLK